MEGHQYRTIAEFEGDFELMINNCISYNAKDTSFYRAAIKLRDQVLTHTSAMADMLTIAILSSYCLISCVGFIVKYGSNRIEQSQCSYK